MAIIDASGASRRLLGLHDVVRGQCLVAAGRVILQGKPVLRHAASAKIEWENTPGKHLKSVGPEGTPVFFAGPAGFFDVAISDGHGNVVGIDTDGRHFVAGEVHVQSIKSRANQVGGRLLGWSSEFLGYQLSFASPAPPVNASVTPDDVKRIATYNGIRGPIYWRGVQLFGRANGMYPAPAFVVSGVPGPRSRAIERFLDANAH
jgi:hypothetical protein